MAQCISIFNRFVARNGPFALNISYATYLESKQRFDSCHRRNMQRNGQMMNAHDEQDILCIFDPVIPDVIDNLENVASRFNVHHIFSTGN